MKKIMNHITSKFANFTFPLLAASRQEWSSAFALCCRAAVVCAKIFSANCFCFVKAGSEENEIL
jgi:hypothetical protein